MQSEIIVERISSNSMTWTPDKRASNPSPSQLRVRTADRSYPKIVRRESVAFLFPGADVPTVSSASGSVILKDSGSPSLAQLWLPPVSHWGGF